MPRPPVEDLDPTLPVVSPPIAGRPDSEGRDPAARPADADPLTPLTWGVVALGTLILVGLGSWAILGSRWGYSRLTTAESRLELPTPTNVSAEIKPPRIDARAVADVDSFPRRWIKTLPDLRLPRMSVA